MIQNVYIPEDMENKIKLEITIEEAKYIKELLYKVDNIILKRFYKKVCAALEGVNEKS